jgi:AcrR family transcriptional regulator
MQEPMDRRIARLALARFRVGGFVGTSIADLAGALGVSKAAIYYHYRSKDTLLHRLIDPLLDAIDACLQDHNQPRRTAQQLLSAYLAILLAHREVVPLITARRRGPQPPQHRSAPARPEPTAPVSADRPQHRRGGQVASRGRPRGDLAPPDHRTPLDLANAAHQHILIDAAVATLQPTQPSPDREPLPAATSAGAPSTRS